ncbi:MAG TPA: hypothetical protein VHB48_18105 [Chitinophagaceae bacterium]|nr:hypothetical protein [Chitinophagaceae bacterium]
MEQFVTFQRFNDINLAMEFAEQLKQLRIYCEIDNQTAPFDVSFANNPLEDDIRIKLRPEDFEKANEALDNYYKSMLGTVDKDYYLLQFSNDELVEVLAKPDEWNRFDIQLAKKLLTDRGRQIPEGKLDELQRARLGNLKKEKRIDGLWLIIGYLLPLLGFLYWGHIIGVVFSIYGSLTGIVAGIVLRYGRKTLPDGSRVYLYAGNVRLHGLLILVLSILAFLSWYISAQIGVYGQ